MNRIRFALILLAGIGILDASYLTYEHYQNVIPPCASNQLFGDCGAVLQSTYASIFGVPVALLGVLYYSILFFVLLKSWHSRKKNWNTFVLLISTVGFGSSVYFVYLQLFVIHAVCLYCMVSAITSTIIFLISNLLFKDDRKRVLLLFIGVFYRHVLKPFFFMIPPEVIHETMTSAGEIVGRIPSTNQIVSAVFRFENSMLIQTMHGITVKNPIGLAAGFDYEAKLTQLSSSIGFGFQSVGTITNNAYSGNPLPMLGRLPKSRSLMVNKGFKNLGAEKTIGKLSGKTFRIPIGVSIGRTNKAHPMTQKESVEDIVSALIKFEQSDVLHSYYELNISCPNLYGNVSFYSKKNLTELLREVDKLNIKRPMYVKMPISETNQNTLEMMQVISKYSPVGIIIGNLQKNRNHPSLDPTEVCAYNVGYFSGKPTFQRSNELISLSYKHFRERFTIIGCGGVFDATDAYEKIQFGASFVQLITGMIYMGPQRIAEINMGIVDLLQKDGYTHISQAIGSKNI